MVNNGRTYCLIVVAVCFFLSCFASYSGFAQLPSKAELSSKDTAKLPLAPPSTRVIVGRIIVQGNRKTKTYIVERELSFQTGDTLNLEDLVKSFSFAHDRLINTHLFNDVVIFLKGFRGYTADIEIDVKERWYIFPVPYFKPVDRNLSAWAQKNYKLNRVNYGGNVSHVNFTGRNDILTAWVITGYTRQFDLYYNQA
jgi:hypothetical protein